MEKKANNELEILIKAIKEQAGYVFGPNDLTGIKEYEDLREKAEDEQKKIILQLISLVTTLSIKQAKVKEKRSYEMNDFIFFGKSIAQSIMSGLLRRKLNYNEAEWIELFRGFKESADKLSKVEDSYFLLQEFPINYAIKQMEYGLKKNVPSKELISFIKEVLRWAEFNSLSEQYYYGSGLKISLSKLSTLLLDNEDVTRFRLKTDDIGESINQIINSITENEDAYHKIFYLAAEASNAKPSKKFSNEIAKKQDKIDSSIFRKVAHRILQVAIDQEIKEKTTTHRRYIYRQTVYLNQSSQQFIKGMVWTMMRYSDQESIRLLSALFEKSYTKIPGKGSAAASIGNACVYVLGNMRGRDGLGALSHLKLKVRQNNVKKAIDGQLEQGAKKYNVSVEELKEMAVPDFQLRQGVKSIPFGEYQLKISIEGRKVIQQWIKPDNSLMKSVPSIVKNNTALSKKLNGIRKETKEIQKVYTAQKQRIDNQFILDRSWDFVSFNKYYLKHGLVSPITEKLIWTFTKGDQSVDAILLEGVWKTIDNKEVDWIDEETTVSLWHPINADEETIIAWREKIIELEWEQPIKQAFREIYILTEAEINTRTYSNRMAAHILKQHQFSALANLRNWKYSLLGAFDDGRDNELCQKYLPEYKLTAEYWIDDLYQDENWNDTGIYLYITTDQLRFKDENGNALELVNVPKMVFTEIMRDVDMFVGVCSVGNDPEWMDNNGERQTNRDYWTSYSFGDLTEIAKTRKSILERLLPRLKKIRDKAHIDGKFLIVKGKLRTYKIHIGSGNILMTPNDQYLCIVPSRTAEKSTDKVFIPFEGDKGLSIVLSKAFLLAEDEKITDNTIMSQIKR